MGDERKTVRYYMIHDGLSGRFFHSVRPDIGRPYCINNIISSEKVDVTFIGTEGEPPTRRTVDNCLDDLEAYFNDEGFKKYL